MIKLIVGFVCGYLVASFIAWYAIQRDLLDGRIDLLTYKAYECKIIRKVIEL